MNITIIINNLSHSSLILYANLSTLMGVCLIVYNLNLFTTPALHQIPSDTVQPVLS